MHNVNRCEQEMNRLHFACPSCGSKTRRHGSRSLHPLLRSSYAQCTNHLCGAIWQLSTEVTAILSSPSSLYAASTPVLPVLTADDMAHEVALQYVVDNVDELDSMLLKCPAYLKLRLGLDPATADLVTRQVLVKQHKQHYIEWLNRDMVIGNDVSVSAPVSND